MPIADMLKLLPPGYDLSRIPQEVREAAMRGETPDMALLPRDLQEYIRAKLRSPTVEVNEVALPVFADDHFGGVDSGETTEVVN